jgi:hypothetical protein
MEKYAMKAMKLELLNMRDCPYCMNARHLTNAEGEERPCPKCRAKGGANPHSKAAMDAAARARNFFHKSHLTEACDHAESDWCQHCEEGCRWCGELEGVDDNGFCERHAFDRAVMRAEAMAEGDR